MKLGGYMSGNAIREAMGGVCLSAFGLMVVSLLVVVSGCSHTRSLGETGSPGSVCLCGATSPESFDEESFSRFIGCMADSFTNGTHFSIVERTHPSFRNSVSNDIVRLEENGWLSAIRKRGCLVRAFPYEGMIGKYISEEFGGVGALWGVSLAVLPDGARLSEGRCAAMFCMEFNVLVPHAGEPCIVGRLLGGRLCEEYMVQDLTRRMHGELAKYEMSYVSSTLSDNPFAWRIANDIQEHINDKDCATIPVGLQFADDRVREAYLRLISSSSVSPAVVLPYLMSDDSYDREGTCVYQFRVEPKRPMVLTGSLSPSVFVGVDNKDWIVIKCQ